METKPQPNPTPKQLAWAVHGALIDTQTPLESIRNDGAPTSFWKYSACNINQIYEKEIYGLKKLAEITPEGVQRHVMANWNDLVQRLSQGDF